MRATQREEGSPMTTLKRLIAASLVAGLMTIAACSGTPGSGSDDPAGVVNSAIAAAESGGFQRLVEFSCAANKDDFANAFGGGDLSQLGAAGINPDELFGALKVDFQDVTATETSKSDTEAKVHLKGKMAISFDEAKMRELMKKVLEAQNLPATDQMIDVAMTSMSSAMSQTQDLDEDLALIKEDGKWVVCS
jgi:hypothetical protein